MRLFVFVAFICVAAFANASVDDDDSDMRYMMRVGRSQNPSLAQKQKQFMLTEYIELARREATPCFEANPDLRPGVISALIDAMVTSERRKDVSVLLLIKLQPCNQLANIVSPIVAAGDNIAISQLIKVVRRA